MREEIQLGENRIILVGTGHVFQESVDLAKTTILEIHPDYVALELDLERLHALETERREKPRFHHMFRMGIRMAIVGSVLSYFQNKVGEQTGVFPGAEMLEAVKTAREVGAEIALIDRSVMITLNRLISSLSVIDTIKIVLYMLFPTKIELKKVDKQVVENLTDELYAMSPSAYEVLISERDRIMADNISKLSGTIVAVVGAGHVKGIRENLIESYKSGNEEKYHEI
jgi:pheromone shutdown-related protein TraB